MPGTKVTGLVIKQSEYGESNRMISVFTKEYGIIRAAVYGAKSMKSGKGAACRLLCFSEFEVSRGQSGIYTVYAADALESFYPISEDIEKLSLAVYLCDITYGALGTENRDDAALSLLMNTLYVLAYKDVPLKKAKCVYELRLMSLAGYRPMLTKCVRCGNIKNIVAFSAHDGGLLCSDCRKNAVAVSKSAVDAMNYIINSDIKKIFSFSVSDEVLMTLEKICEEYVRVQLDAEFPSLLYFKKILI